MSAVVCGKRSSFFEDIPSSPPLTKRIHFSDSPPLRYSTSSSISQSPHLLPLDYLIALFPHMDKQLLDRALKECGEDLNSAIRSLNELQLGSVENLGSATGKPGSLPKASTEFQDQDKTSGETAGSEDTSGAENHEMDSSDWVELLVREMMNASNMDDARIRASRALEFLEKSICARATMEAAQGQQQENIMLKEQLQALVQENILLKRAVSIQHERQKEFEDKSQELHNLKQMVSQYQEQLRTLEVNNYALTMHLRQAQQSNSISGRFHPDVF